MCATKKRNRNRVPVWAVGVPAPHYANRTLAALIIAARIGVPKDDGIAMVVDEPWAATKQRFRVVQAAVTRVVIPQLLPPRPPEPLMLQYPPAHYETDGRQRQRLLWLRATKF